MPFIRKSQIPIDIRKPYTDAYRDRLRQSLLDPSLSATQKAVIKAQIDDLMKGVSTNPGGTTSPVDH